MSEPVVPAHWDGPLRLVPVVALRAEDYSSRPTPWDDPAQLEQHWARCLADAGVEGLVPIEDEALATQRRVPVEQLTSEPVLLAIVRRWLSLDALEQLRTGEHMASDLDGGYALFAGPVLLLGPRCCAALCTFHDWQEAIASPGDQWQGLWIGHPHAGVRREGERMVFCNDLEAGPQPAFDVELQALALAVEECERELGRFAQRLAAALEPWIGAEAAAPAARVLAGLEGHTTFTWGTPEDDDEEEEA